MQNTIELWIQQDLEFILDMLDIREKSHCDLKFVKINSCFQWISLKVIIAKAKIFNGKFMAVLHFVETII
jgi:hypothetical protein